MGMGKFIGKLFGNATGGIVESIGNVADKFITTDEEKAEFNLRMEKIVSSRLSELENTTRTELRAKENIIVAELNQDDKYTKRTRPLMMRLGMYAIIFNYCIVPLILQISVMFGKTIEIAPFNLPVEFWISWGSLMSIYSLGRSAEKSGIKNKATSLITGSKKSLFD